ncbi:hypothetical protein P4E94_17625 [Pontiellaceae bacterium B12219]|nr:hypothetical protein [Pontiellaceae bacterium B12219]
MIGFAQVPEMVTAAQSSNGWPLSYFLPLILWPVGVFSLLLIICLVTLRPLRKRGLKKAKILTLVLPIIGWAIWHFYPSLTVRGYYEGKYEWFDKTEVEYVEIRDTYIFIGNDEYPDEEAPYRLNPVQRLIWVKIDAPEMEYVPVKLGWNKIYQPVIKVGLVKFKKISNEAINRP